ncbi:hypothetical protein D9M68_688080 [compost metagenome]
MRGDLGPAGRVRGARAGDGAVGHAALQRLLRLAEGNGHGNAAELFDELGERLVVHAHLLALQVGQAADRHLAEHHLRTEGIDAQQLAAVALLQPLVEGVAVGIDHLARHLVVGRQAHDVGAQEEGLVARHLRQAQGDDVEQARLQHAQAVGVFHAQHVHRLVVGVDGQARVLREVFEEGLLLGLLDQPGGHQVAGHAQAGVVRLRRQCQREGGRDQRENEFQLHA